MTPEVKKRIEQIRRGEVPEGYKRTKVGILPGEWEITKLNLISSHVTNKNTNGEVQTTFTNSATQGVIKQTDYFDKEISSRESITSYYIVQENDYIYNPRISVSAPCGPINKSHFPDNGVVSPLYTVFKMNDGLQENKYIEFYFKSSLWYKYMCGVANYGARHDRMNITNDDLFGMPIPFPPLAEQEKIAEILSAQDKLIELQQKKIEELKRLKKVYLSKLFPKKGCNVPEIRFPGFTDPWEQRKLGEVAIYRRGSFPQPYGKSEWYDGDGAMPFVQVADVSDEMNLVEDTKQKISILAQPMSVFAEKNSVLVTLQGSIGRVAITQYGAFVDRTVLIFEKYKAEIDKTFWAYIIKQKFIDEARNAPGGTIKTITKEALSDFELSIPNYQEQKQIGAYFRNLDDLITLHQRKLEEMKKLKKALMQLLLTGIVRV